ncbi:MAG: hypothetical protein IS860_05090 [Nitrosopumilus sp.]|nr:hypothetical protein [Nitrosopumilus sp.]
MESSIPSKLNTMGFEQICSSENEVTEFIHNLKHKDHCIFVFEDEQIRDKVVNEFINLKTAKNILTACFSTKPEKYDCNHQITYDKLVQEQKLQPIVISDLLLNVLSESYQKDQARIVCEETSWLAENGMFDEHQKMGSEMDEKVFDESTIMCCYNASKLNDAQMDTVLSSRRYIILEKPFSVYEKKDF